jgi:hypothetical protein
MTNTIFPNAQNNPAAAIPVNVFSPTFSQLASLGTFGANAFNYVTIGHMSGIASSTTNIDVCEQGTLVPFLTAAEYLSFVSTSAQDAPAGSGATSVYIDGLDGNYNRLSETIATNGTTAVQTVNKYLRVNKITTAGGGGQLANTGTITFTSVVTSKIQGVMKPNIGNIQQAVFTVPNGFSGIIKDIEYSMMGAYANVAEMALGANVFASNTWAISVRAGVSGGYPFDENVFEDYVFPSGTDITIRMLNCGQSSTEISAALRVTCVANSLLANY